MLVDLGEGCKRCEKAVKKWVVSEREMFCYGGGIVVGGRDGVFVGAVNAWFVYLALRKAQGAGRSRDSDQLNSE